MPIHPSLFERIGANINANVENDRIALAAYLDSIESDDELFRRCLSKAVRCLKKFERKDEIWLKKWLPIIFTNVKNGRTDFGSINIKDQIK